MPPATEAMATAAMKLLSCCWCCWCCQRSIAAIGSALNISKLIGFMGGGQVELKISCPAHAAGNGCWMSMLLIVGSVSLKSHQGAEEW